MKSRNNETKIRVDTTTDAVLLNRYVALVRNTKHNTRGGLKKNVPISTKQHLQIQWKNITADIKGFFRNPMIFAPRIAYSLLAFFFIFQGKYLDAHLTAFFMGAIAFDAAGNSTDNGEPTSITYSITIGSGSDRYVIWGVQGFGQVLSSTFDGNSATVVINKSDDQKIWGYTAPGSGSKNIVVSTGGGGSIMASVAVSFSGVHQTTPTGATNYAESANPRSISLTTTTANAMRVDFGVCINDSASDPTSSIDTGTERAEKTNAHNQFRVHIAVSTNPQAVAGAATYTWTFTNEGFYQIAYAIEIKEAGAAATAIKDIIGVGMIPSPR